MYTLEWHTEIGPVTRTRYPGLLVWRQDRGIWRHLVHDAPEAWVTGPPFVTKTEALAALYETADRLY